MEGGGGHILQRQIGNDDALEINSDDSVIFVQVKNVSAGSFSRRAVRNKCVEIDRDENDEPPASVGSAVTTLFPARENRKNRMHPSTSRNVLPSRFPDARQQMHHLQNRNTRVPSRTLRRGPQFSHVGMTRDDSGECNSETYNLNNIAAILKQALRHSTRLPRPHNEGSRIALSIIHWMFL